jgi:CRISPR-associated protein (TIGR03986 family)
MTIRGILVVEGKVLKVQFTNANGKEVAVIIRDDHTAQSIFNRKKSQLAELAGMAVDLEVENAQPRQVRPQGESWQSNNTDRQQRNIQNDRSGNNRDRQTYQNNPNPQTQAVNPPVASVPGDFHNPYNFIPALPRNLKVVDSELGDREPVGHDRYLPDRWSGSIRVKLTTKTPLLIPDAFQVSEDEKGHKTFPLRMLNGKPYLPPTSIKGMLRSAYEAVTNSRLSIFSQHDERLFYRSAAQVKTVYPAIVVESEEDEQKYLKILSSSGVVSYVGRLPRYKKTSLSIDKGESIAALNYDNSDDRPQHGDKVWVRLNPDERSAQDLPPDVRADLPRTLMPNVVTRIQRHTSDSPPGNGKWYEGWVFVTGANINGKTCERVFLAGNDDPKFLLTPEIERLWIDLIDNYQDTNQKQLKERREEGIFAEAYLGNDPGKTGFSRHLCQPEAEKLKVSSLCYVEFDLDVSRTSAKITALLPVTISRHLYSVAPQTLLDSSLQPAQTPAELSPADRVFGWVNQHGTGAYAGNLRIYDVQCITSDPTQPLGDRGLPLAILGQPKPQQGRFYTAKDNQGTPVDVGISKQDLYQPGMGLRGRKVYPHHHSLPNNYWDTPLEDRTQINNEGTFQEYRRPRKLLEQKSTQNQPTSQRVTPKPVTKKISEQQDNQNRSITEWVKPDVTFEFNIDITNLSSVELGALMWLLTLPDNHYHRLGGGKPFGFGSVTLAIATKPDLRTGQDWQTYYSSLLTPLTPADFDRSIPISAFKQAVTDAYRSDFSEVSFIKAFCQAARGFDDGKPIHYPRVTPNPTPDGESFKWFTANEKNKPPRQYSLGSLIADLGLPLFTEGQR